jgi:hypothetical protein
MFSGQKIELKCRNYKAKIFVYRRELAEDGRARDEARRAANSSRSHQATSRQQKTIPLFIQK